MDAYFCFVKTDGGDDHKWVNQNGLPGGDFLVKNINERRLIQIVRLDSLAQAKYLDIHNLSLAG